MVDDLKDRACKMGNYIVENNSTVRKTAEYFGISKSTVHIDISKRLSFIDPVLYSKVRKVLDKNKSERHIRGGMATKQKYLLIK